MARIPEMKAEFSRKGRLVFKSRAGCAFACFKFQITLLPGAYVRLAFSFFPRIRMSFRIPVLVSFRIPVLVSFRIPVLVSFRTPPWCHLGHYFSTGRASSYHVELKVMRVTRMTLQACHDLSAACA